MENTENENIEKFKRHGFFTMPENKVVDKRLF